MAHAIERNVTRRGFVKTSALAGLALGVSGAGLTGCSGGSTTIAPDRISTAGYQYESEQAEGTWYHSACQRNCFDTCMIRSKVVDGRLVQVRGDENNPYTAGGLCVKTQSYVDWTYRDDRILYPLKRTGTKGEGCTFERISWDEAIETITTKWKEIIKEHGGEAITWSRYQGNQGSWQRRCLEPLFYKMGATYCEGSMCNNGYVYSLPYTTGGVPVMRAEDIANVDLYVTWGHNAAATTLHTMKFIKEMHKKGGKIVVINPIRIPEVMWADLHVQIRPGTDVAFALGVGKYLIENKKYDAAWIKQWGHGFDDYKKACAEWSADKVAEECGVPAEQVAQVGDIIWENRKNMLMKTGLSIGRRRTGGMTHISIKCLTGLIGHPECYFNMTSSGGLQDWSNGAPAMADKMLADVTLPSEANPVGSIRNYSSPDLGKVLAGENFGKDHDFSKNPILSLFIFGNNPLVSHPNLNKVREGLAREDLFTIVNDMFWTPSCDYADIVLPAPSSFEYEEFNGGYGHNYSVFNEKIIETMGECVPNHELCNMLGQAMGYDDEAFHRDAQWFYDLFMTDKPYTFDELREKGWISRDPKSWDDVYKEGFPTPSGKFQFASDELKHDHGHAAPFYERDGEGLRTEDTELLKKYPLAIITPCAKEFLNGCFGNLPDNNILFNENYVYMNTEDAAARSINDGDAVIVFNDRGELHRVARVIEGQTHPGVVYSYKSTWSTVTGVENSNSITSDARADIGRGVTFGSCLAEIRKA